MTILASIKVQIENIHSLRWNSACAHMEDGVWCDTAPLWKTRLEVRHVPASDKGEVVSTAQVPLTLPRLFF